MTSWEPRARTLPQASIVQSPCPGRDPANRLRGNRPAAWAETGLAGIKDAVSGE
jgi:hypothetical protein